MPFFLAVGSTLAYVNVDQTSDVFKGCVWPKSVLSRK